MSESTYLCHQCRSIFKLPAACSITPEKRGVKCPDCGSAEVAEMPSWEPTGSDLSEGQPTWEYQCQQCRNTFRLPVPGSPLEEKGIICPACGGGHIHRLTSVGGEPLYCG